MKRVKTRRSKQNETKSNASAIVNMEGRSNVRICFPEEKDMLDSEFLQIQMLAQQQREEIKRVYYCTNTPVSSTIDRTFLDLFKRFVQLKFGETL